MLQLPLVSTTTGDGGMSGWAGLQYSLAHARPRAESRLGREAAASAGENWYWELGYLGVGQGYLAVCQIGLGCHTC